MVEARNPAGWGLLGVLLCCLVSPAQAGTPESPARVLVHPGDPSRLVVGYAYVNGGLVSSDDGGDSWSLICSSAMGFTREPSSVGLAGDGSVYLGRFDAMVGDDGSRCAWHTQSAFDGNWVSDIVADPVAQDTVYALTSSGGALNGVYRRVGQGDWEPTGSLQEVLATRLRVAELASGGRRFYQSGSDGEHMTQGPGGLPRYETIFMLRYSDDLGANWTKLVYGALAGSFKLEQVDPTNPDRVVVSVDNAEGEQDWVLVSDDRGESFRELLRVEEFGGTAMAPDGTLWVGDRKGGLYGGPASGDALPQLDGRRPITCLSYDPGADALYACSALEVGRLARDGSDYEAILHIASSPALQQCGEQLDVAGLCEEQLFTGYCKVSHYPESDLCHDNYPERATLADGSSGPRDGGVEPLDDAGTPGFDADAGQQAPPPTDGNSGGCRVGSPGRSWAAAGMWLLALAWLARRRRV